MVLDTARGATAFYDIDTQVTLGQLADGTCDYLSAALIPGFDLYLSFTGGPALDYLATRWGARAARPLYCSLDAELYRPAADDRPPTDWDLGYLGTYSDDRQKPLEALLCAAARRLRKPRFVVAGPEYPHVLHWPANCDRIK